MSSKRTAGLEYELAHWRQGQRAIVGIDEAGRGAWAGPVMAGAVCLSPGEPEALRQQLESVRDSKQHTPRGRERLEARIQGVALAWGVGQASAAEIDALGIVPATCLAMRRALEALIGQRPGFTPDHLLLDSIRCAPFDLYTIGAGLPTTPIVRGDQLSLSIAAASILAKLARDRFMVEQAASLPEYGFAAHKGYGTQAHQRALAEHGATGLHRMSFAPLKRLSAS